MRHLLLEVYPISQHCELCTTKYYTDPGWGEGLGVAGTPKRLGGGVRLAMEGIPVGVSSSASSSIASLRGENCARAYMDIRH